MSNNLSLRIEERKIIATEEQQCWSRVISVVSDSSHFAGQFQCMCASLEDDVQNPDGSGQTMLGYVNEIGSCAETYIDTGGNAWITYLTPDVVWFEGQYDQTDGETGAVTFRQYKLALETYLRFLADPNHRTIEVPFPDEPTPAIPDVSEIRERLERESIEDARIYRLNSRDREVLDAIRSGMPEAEICAMLKLDFERLTGYRAEALEKTGLRSLSEVFEMIDRVKARKAEREAKETRRRSAGRL